jgi:hypothetical protein
MSEELFDKLVEDLVKRLLDQDAVIKNLRQEIEMVKAKIEDKSDTVSEISLSPVPVNIPAAAFTDFTQLPAYTNARIFKELKRPKNLNDLYMLVLQSQHQLNQLQIHVDNILRRN